MSSRLDAEVYRCVAKQMAVKRISFTFTAELGFLVRCAARLLTFVLALGLPFVSLLRAFVQTLLCFHILDAVLHALGVGYGSTKNGFAPNVAAPPTTRQKRMP
jgi:hypothetical protein